MFEPRTSVELSIAFAYWIGQFGLVATNLQLYVAPDFFVLQQLMRPKKPLDPHRR